MLILKKQLVFIQVCHYVGGYYTFNDFIADTGQRDGSVIFCLGFMTFLVDRCHLGILPVIRDHTFCQVGIKNICKNSGYFIMKLLQYWEREVVRSGCFPRVKLRELLCQSIY